MKMKLIDIAAKLNPMLHNPELPSNKFPLPGTPRLPASLMGKADVVSFTTTTVLGGI